MSLLKIDIDARPTQTGCWTTNFINWLMVVRGLKAWRWFLSFSSSVYVSVYVCLRIFMRVRWLNIPREGGWWLSREISATVWSVLHILYWVILYVTLTEPYNHSARKTSPNTFYYIVLLYVRFLPSVLGYVYIGDEMHLKCTVKEILWMWIIHLMDRFQFWQVYLPLIKLCQ